jgi:uncharacterized membrane protein YidH (DUF202 family)
MKSGTYVGAALIIFGLLAFVFQGVRYTSRDTVLDVGPLHATAERQKTLAISPVIAGAAVLGGVVLLVLGVRRRGAVL